MTFFARKGSPRIFVRPKRRRVGLVAAGVLLLAAAAVLYPRPDRNVALPPAALPHAGCPPWAEGLCEPRANLFERAAGEEPAEDPSKEVLVGAVKAGQTLGDLLGGHVDAAALGALAPPEDFAFESLRTGQAYRVTLRDREFVAFEYDVSPTETLVIDGRDGELAARVETRESEVRREVMAGTVDSSLFRAVEEAGGTAETAVALADVFASDIDFCRDVQPGDSFRAVVERRYVEGEYVGTGRVLAARFVNQGKVHEGFALTDGKGRDSYCDADGRPLRKTFLRAPLSFLRITSRYSGSRLHPILKVRKPHFGVDYAAPTGTPVWSVGAGVVVERGRNPAAGNYVTVRHGASWATRYNHLSRFAKDLAKGAKVDQGQVIGYVGQTGYATGPHLDFRVYKDGKPVNALDNPQMTADALPAAALARFRREAARLAALMDGKERVKDVADREPVASGRLQ
ncbi:peptidoglycan DD-metalloendopeptidase family protein [Solidesulfovibrio sp.]|uniref:M23 family metallopeptidase n=1 Tax=Solidesulfovibrio sp. TaxID=2910990 RepID=UPI00261B48F8|nr:peptidoglycan DD-metalloendopeptidase family protein [Solidesulfovibrio sp.]